MPAIIRSLHIYSVMHSSFFFFFNDTATTEIYTLSLHDALPISRVPLTANERLELTDPILRLRVLAALTSNVSLNAARTLARSEEHTSELQSQSNLVCRLLLEKKKTKISTRHK